MADQIEQTLPSTPKGRKSYKSLKHLIKTQIKQGKYEAHERLPGMRALCEQYKISLATVQRALTELCDESILYSQVGRGTFVAPLRVECKRVGILCGMGISGLKESMFGSLMQTVQQRAIEDDKSVSLFQGKIENNGLYTKYNIKDIIKHEFDILILVNVVNLGLIASLKELGAPIIVTDLDATDIGVHSLYFDNEASAFDMTRKLAQDGHEHIWFIGGIEQPSQRYDLCLRQRETGYRLGCRAEGLKSILELKAKNYNSAQLLKERVEFALRTHDRPTAVVTEHGPLVSQVFKDIGIPVDIASWAPESRVAEALTYSRYVAVCDFADMGEKTYDLLKDIDNGLETGMVRVVIKSEIMNK